MTTTTIDKLTKKINKLTQSISQASNYLQLQNVIDTFNTIKSSLQSNTSTKNIYSQKYTQQIKLLQTTEQLIKQKIKYFKKKALKKLQAGKINYQQAGKMKQEQAGKYDHQNNIKIDKNNHKTNQLSHCTTVLRSSNQKRKNNQSITYDDQQDQILSQRKKDQFKKSHQSPSQINNSSLKINNSSSKRLKQSKSVDNLFDKRKQKQSITFNNDKSGFYNQDNDECSNKKKNKVMNQSQFGSWKKNRDKNHNNIVDFDDQKTQIKMVDNNAKKDVTWLNNLDQKGKNRNNRQWRQYNTDGFQGNTQYMQKMMQWMYKTRILGEQNGFELTKRKLTQKVLQLQQLKGRLRYYQNENSELKKRVLNEQRRQQDYIMTLKEKIKQNQQQLYQQDKQKKLMAQLIQQLQLKMQTQQKQISTYSKQLQQALVSKQLAQSQSQSQTINLKKQLQLLSKHHSSLQDLQQLLSQQKVNNNMLIEKNTLLNKQVQQLKQHLVILTNDKNTLQQLLEIKLQQIQAYQQQIYQLKKQLSQEQVEKQHVTSQLQALQIKQAQWIKKKDNQQKRKIQKLKQVKSLLSQQV